MRALRVLSSAEQGLKSSGAGYGVVCVHVFLSWDENEVWGEGDHCVGAHSAQLVRIVRRLWYGLCMCTVQIGEKSWSER